MSQVGLHSVHGYICRCMSQEQGVATSTFGENLTLHSAQYSDLKKTFYHARSLTGDINVLQFMFI